MNKLYNILLEILEEYPILALFLPATWVLSDKPTSPPSLKIENNNFFRGGSRRNLASK